MAFLANRVKQTLRELLEDLKYLLVRPEQPAEVSLVLRIPLNLPNRHGVSPQLQSLTNLSPRAVVCSANNQQTNLLADCLEQNLQTQLWDFLDSSPLKM
jgi:hypothetical protein